MWYINGIYLAFKKNEIMSFVSTWMDLKIVILSEISQTEKEKYHRVFLTRRIYREMIQINLFTKQKHVHRLRE